MRKTHDTWVYDDSGRKQVLQTGSDPSRWHCDFCGTTNERHGDDWPTCVYCGRFRDGDIEVVYDWG